MIIIADGARVWRHVRQYRTHSLGKTGQDRTGQEGGLGWGGGEVLWEWWFVTGLVERSWCVTRWMGGWVLPPHLLTGFGVAVCGVCFGAVIDLFIIWYSLYDMVGWWCGWGLFVVALWLTELLVLCLLFHIWFWSSVTFTNANATGAQAWWKIVS